VKGEKVEGGTERVERESGRAAGKGREGESGTEKEFKEARREWKGERKRGRKG
jgi:hypothetical protein